jgi:hypothetical protein
MARTYTDRARLGTLTLDELLWHEPLNTSANRLESLMPVGGLCVGLEDPETPDLEVRVGSGRYTKSDGTEATYAGATAVAIPASSTRCVWLDDAAALQQGAAFPSTRHTPLAVVTTSGTAVTAIEDRRPAFGQVGSNALPFLPLTGGTFTDTSVVVLTLGTANGVRIGATSSDKLGFYGATPIARPSAFTQTYSTADKTLGSYTADVENVAYTGAADGEAKLVDLNNLRIAYENLRAHHEDLAQFVNALLDHLQSLGLAS